MLCLPVRNVMCRMIMWESISLRQTDEPIFEGGWKSETGQKHMVNFGV